MPRVKRGTHRRAEQLGGLSMETGDRRLPMGQIAARPWEDRSFYVRDPFGNPLWLRRLPHSVHRQTKVVSSHRRPRSGDGAAHALDLPEMQ